MHELAIRDGHVCGSINQIITYEEVDKKKESEHDVDEKERVGDFHAASIGLC